MLNELRKLSVFYILGLFSFNLEYGNAGVIISRDDARDYLSKFGWIANDESEKDEVGHSKSVRGALMDFQSYFGLSVTGRLDNETITLMKTPRCGVPDKFEADKTAASRRKKRYVLQGSPWPKDQLTYRLTKYMADDPTRSQVNNEIQKAFRLWEVYTNLDFIEDNVNSDIDIDIKFERGDHGDGHPFRDDLMVLAHAFYPAYGGDIHFNQAQEWRVDKSGGNDVKQVAAHEIGHSLGLDHSNEDDSIMYPIVYNDAKFELHSDDILGIQDLYGKKSVGNKEPVIAPTTTALPIPPITNQTPDDDCTCRLPPELDCIPHHNMHSPAICGNEFDIFSAIFQIDPILEIASE